MPDSDGQEGVEHAHALNGMLLHTIHEFRLWNSGSFENGRRHIDAMAKLPTASHPELAEPFVARCLSSWKSHSSLPDLNVHK